MANDHIIFASSWALNEKRLEPLSLACILRIQAQRKETKGGVNITNYKYASIVLRINDLTFLQFVSLSPRRRLNAITLK